MNTYLRPLSLYDNHKAGKGIVTRKLSKIPKWDFIFARVKTGQVGTWSSTEISPVQSSFLGQIRTGILREGII